MNQNSIDNKRIFNVARKIDSPEARSEYLDQVCKDVESRRQVLELLNAFDREREFLESPPSEAVQLAQVANADQPERQIGPYRIREQIGEGGMGVVYVAEQTEPVQRKVAIKIIKPGMDTKEVIARFEAERQALAFMEHPNIARVLDAGATKSGRSYFVMELVRGIPITEYCDQMKATPQERLELFKAVCDAVQHAHQKGIIHRDIKPSNVLVTQINAKPVVKVIDFGLAKATSGQKLTDKSVYTGFMKLMGTPVYMSPEQAGLSGLDVDTRSDVYSLGILLYELLTGTTPLDKTEIQKQAYDELCRQIREVEAPKPSARISTLNVADRSTVAQQRQVEPKTLRQLLDGDLDVVVLKALEKDRDRRYESPKELAADIDRFLTDKPVQAVPPSPFYLARKYSQRHRAAIITVAGIVSLLILATAFSSWQAIRATRYGKESEAAKNEAVAARKVADDSKLLAENTSVQRRRELYVSNMQLAAQLWNSAGGSQDQIDELLAAWIPVDEQPDLRDFVWRYQWSLLHHNSQQSLFDTGSSAFSSEGSLLTSGSRGIREWNRTGGLIKQHWRDDASQCVFSSNGLWGAIPAVGKIQLINLKSNTSHDLPGTRFSFSSNNQFIACWQSQGDVTVWEIGTGTPRRFDVLRSTALANLPGPRDLSLAPDGKSFMLKGRHEVMAFLNGQVEPLSWAFAPPVGSWAWSPDGKLIAIGLLSGKIHLHHKSRPAQRISFGSHGTMIDALTFSADSKILAAGGRDGTIDLWEIQAEPKRPAATDSDDDRSARPRPAAPAQELLMSPTLVRSIKAHIEAVQTIAFSHDGSEFVSTDKIGVTKRWDSVDDGSAIPLEDVAENLFGGTVGIEVEAAEDSVTITEVKSGYPAAETEEIAVGDKVIGISGDQYPAFVKLVGMSEASVVKALSGRPGSKVTLHLQKANGDEAIAELTRKRIKRIMSCRVACSPKTDSLAVASLWFGATLWNGDERRARRLPYRGFSVAYSPDGRYLAMDDIDRIVIWDLEKDDTHASFPLRTTNPGQDGGASLSISPDGKSLAAGTGSPFNHRYRTSELRVWDMKGLKEITAGGGEKKGDGRSDASLHQNNYVFASVIFALGGKRLIAADHHGVIRIWDTKTWSLQQTLGGTDNHQSLATDALNFGQATAMAIARDGSTLAIGFGFTQSTSSAVVLWDVAANKRIRTISVPRPMGLAFSPDDRTLASTDEHHKVTLWNVATGLPLRSFDAHNNVVFGVDFSSDGTKLATTDIDGVLRIWEAQPFEEIDRHPLTLRAMFRLGAKQNRERRFAEAESTLRRLLQIQKATLRADDPSIAEAQTEVTKSLEGQGKLPIFVLQPESVTAAAGDEVVFRTELGDGDWTLQWFRNGQPIDGATQRQVSFRFEGEEDFGCYHAEAFPKGQESVAQPVRSGYAYALPKEPVRNRGLRWEVFHDIPGKLVADLTATGKYQKTEPDARSIIQDFAIPSNAGDNYGGRATGFLIPPVTGQYVFYLCSDGQGQLFLNDSDESPQDEEMVADTRWTPKRKWRSSSAKSRPIYLERGMRYSVRALYKEGTASDYLAVAWQMPGQPPPQDGDPPIPGLFLQHRPE